MKENPEITENTERKLIQHRGDFEACREIMLIKDTPGWGRVRTIIEANLGALENKLDAFEKINEHGIRFILKEKKDLLFFIDLVDGAADRAERLHQEISLLEGKLSERKHKPVTAGSSTGV